MDPRSDLIGALIARHAVRLAERNGDRALEALRACGLCPDGERVVKADGSELDDDDAYRYKEAIRSLFGEIEYARARINFVLSGCNCRACTEFRNSLVTGIGE